MYASVSTLNHVALKRCNSHKSSDSSGDDSDSVNPDNLVIAAQDVVKAVETLVPSEDGNSFSKWAELNETE